MKPTVALGILLITACTHLYAAVTPLIEPLSSHLSTTLIWNYLEHIEKPTPFMLTVTPGTSRTSRPEAINEFLFDSSCIKNRATFIVSGSNVPLRNRQKDWLADNYGLPSDFVSAIYTQPRAKKSFLTFTGYVDLHRWIPRLYLQIEAPFVHTNWDLKLLEKIIQPGVNGYDPGYISPDSIPRSDLLNSFTSYIMGKDMPTIGSLTVDPLRYAKIRRCGKTKNAIAHISTILGYDLYVSDHLALTLTGRGVIPLGNRPTGRYLFEPIVGSHHGQLGAGISGYWRYHIHQHEHEFFIVYINCTVDHLFSTNQTRTFDLKDKPLSRYMLATQLSHEASHTDIQKIAPLANLTNLAVKATIPCQTQLTLMCAYEQEKWNWMFGYNLFIQTPEKIKLSCPSLLDTQSWTLYNDQSTILATDDIDIHDTRTKKNAYTLFSQIYYTGKPRRHITPFVGCGASIDVGPAHSIQKYQVEPYTINTALSTWTVWLNAGFACN